MNFNKHTTHNGSHSYLSPSKHSWVNYDEEKLISSYQTSLAASKGTRLHALAKYLIELDVKLPAVNKTLNNFVNDAIGYKMTPEVVLFFSPYAFGTADAISFRNNLLRIHDLKTGYGKVEMLQLDIYAAFFCLEYGYVPKDIDIELRIYQGRDIIIAKPDGAHIKRIIEKTKRFDKLLREYNGEIDEGGSLWMS